MHGHLNVMFFEDCSCTYKFSSYLRENTIRDHYKNKSVNFM